MTVTSPDRATYEQQTRSHYRDPSVAERYARRQSLRRSPAEWLVGVLEKFQVRRGLRRLAPGGVDEVLDAPAGSGKLQKLLTQKSRFYCASDISPAMLIHGGRAKATVIADAAHLPFRSGAFEVAVCLRLLHRVPSSVMEAMVGEIARVSRAGAVLSYGGHARFSGLHRLIQRLTGRTGQSVLRVDEEQLVAVVRANGGQVVLDRSISFGLTAERVAVITRTVTALR